MTAPKGTRREQVQRLKVRALEAFIHMLEDKEIGWPAWEELKEFRELCEAANDPEDNVLDEIRKRLTALELSVGQVTGHAMETSDGVLKLG